jgi:hypothetical protein
MTQPWSFGAALAASRNAETEQRRVESEVTLAYREHARAQRTYSCALARRMLELKAAGMAITACETVAKGDPRIAELREERDVKEGLRETAKHAAWRANADRRDTNDLIRWAAKRDLAEYYGPAEAEPEHMTTFGGARA